MTTFTSFPLNGVTINNLPIAESALELTDKLALIKDGITIKSTLGDVQSLFQTTNTSSSSVIAYGDSVSMITNIPVDVTSLSLAKGSWISWGNVYITPSAQAQVNGWTSDVSATVPDQSLTSTFVSDAGVEPIGFCVPQRIYTLSVPTIIYLSAKAIFSGGDTLICGGLYALQI